MAGNVCGSEFVVADLDARGIFIRHPRRENVDLATLNRIQIIRKVILAAGVLLVALIFACTASAYQAGGPVKASIKWIGIAAMILCILGRCWCTLYIGGRKSRQLVTVGPYSVSRNPLYLFAMLGAAGVGLQHGSVLPGILTCAATALVFYVVVLQEERFLAGRHGAEFAAYMELVPRFLPNLRLWRDAQPVTVMWSRVLRTFADGLFFLVSIPLAYTFERLQDTGALPVFAYLY